MCVCVVSLCWHLSCDLWLITCSPGVWFLSLYDDCWCRPTLQRLLKMRNVWGATVSKLQRVFTQLRLRSMTMKYVSALKNHYVSDFAMSFSPSILEVLTKVSPKCHGMSRNVSKCHELSQYVTKMSPKCHDMSPSVTQLSLPVTTDHGASRALSA